MPNNNKEELKLFWDDHLKNWSSAYDKNYTNLSLLEKLAHIIRTKLIHNRQEYILSLLKNKIQNKKILELGCGNGILSESLIKLEPLHLTCIDISTTAVKLTKERLKPYKYSQLTIINADIEKMKIDFDSYDIIIAMGVTQYLNTITVNNIFFSTKSKFIFDYINEDHSVLNVLHTVYRYLKFIGKKSNFPKYNKLHKKKLEKLNKLNKNICFLKKNLIYYSYYL